MGMTPRLSLPLLAPGQAQKELFHNEALQLIDMLVEGAPSNTPPSVGNCYLIGTSPAGDWSGHAGQLAGMSAGGWRFVVPRDGMSALVRSSGLTAVFRSGAWGIGTLSGSKVEVGGVQVIGARAAAIPGPSSGSVVDAESRVAIGLILVALRQHGLIET